MDLVEGEMERKLGGVEGGEDTIKILCKRRINKSFKKRSSKIQGLYLPCSLPSN